MEYVAGVSSGVLGFIHGNMRGARLGYQAGRALYKRKYSGSGSPNMAPISPKRLKKMRTPRTPKRRRIKHMPKHKKKVHWKEVDARFHSEMGHTSVKFDKKRGKGRKKKGPVAFVLNQQYGGLCGNAAALQGSTNANKAGTQMVVGNIAAMASIDQIIIQSSGSLNNATSTAIPWFNMNPEQYTTGGPLFSAYTGAGTSTPIPVDKIRCQGIVLDGELCNFSPGAVHADLYFVLAKTTHGTYPDTAWDAAYSTQALGTSQVANPVGGSTDANRDTTGYTSVNTLWAKPTESVEFNKLWKIVKKVPITLAGGATEQVKFTYKVDKVVDRQTINQIKNVGGTTNPNHFIGGFSMCTMLVARGQPVLDTTNANLSVTTAGVQLGWVCNVRTFLSPVANSKARVRTNQTVSVLTAPAYGAYKLVTVVDANSTMIDVTGS